MPGDAHYALRNELNNALAVLAPQIKGLHDLVATSISDELRTELNVVIADRERRSTLIQAVLAALDGVVTVHHALVADGYPALGPVPVITTLFAEIQDEINNLGAAAAVFQNNQATTLTIALGEPTDKSVKP